MRIRARHISGPDIETALAEDRLAIFLQPVVELASATGGGTAAGAPRVAYHECLARILMPGAEPLTAARFVPAAERDGQIHAVDRRVLAIALDLLGRHPGISLAVNVSGLTVTDRGWLTLLNVLLAGRGDVARRLVVEITETAAMGDIQDAFRFVGTVKDAGCRVALDDFGAGYTSFSQLRELPVDIVKIDGAYVGGVTEPGRQSRFIEALATLAHYRGCVTVAECVESEEQGESLARLGVQFLQGYRYGRPGAAETVLAAA